MVTTATIEGTCDPRFGAVRERFAENFERFPEVGAAVAAMVDGRMVVDLWGGHADAARTRPWQRDTIVNVASCTKGMVAVCAHMLVDRGLLDIEAPVASYWPEFAQAEKANVLVRHVLSHQAGLAAIDKPLPRDAPLDWDMMVRALEEQAPLWGPGTGHGYHASTWGFLAGEIIRRITGRSVGAFLRDEVTAPLNSDFSIGFGPELDARCADVIPPPPPPPGEESFMTAVLRDPNSLAARVHGAAYRGERLSREYRAAEIPSGNGHGNARGMARVFGALARGGELDGVRLLSAEAIERASADQTSGLPDMLAASPERSTRRSLGFTLPTPNLYMGPGERTFGHAGMGGSLEFADPDSRLSFAYTPNQHLAGQTSDDPRRRSLIDAVYDGL